MICRKVRILLYRSVCEASLVILVTSNNQKTDLCELFGTKESHVEDTARISALASSKNMSVRKLTREMGQRYKRNEVKVLLAMDKKYMKGEKRKGQSMNNKTSY